jgi:hypothetical protein
MMNKWSQWYSSLPAHTKQCLSTQAVWRDSDLLKFSTLAFAVGILVGIIL